MAKATFPVQSQTVAESTKPTDADGFVASDHRNAYSAVYQGDMSPLRPRAKSPAALAINVAPAEIESFYRQIYWNNNHVKFAGGDSPNFTAPTSNPRIDLLVLDVSGGPTGVLTRIAGTEAASPAEPALPDLKTNIPICYVYTRVGQVKIVNFEDSGANPTEGYVYRDVRPMFGTSGGAAGVPSGAVIIWTGASCPAGYTRVSALDGKFLVGGASYNAAAGGSDSISGTTGSGGNHSHSISGTTSGASGCSIAWNASKGTCGVATDDAAQLNHTHSGGSLAAASGGDHSHSFSFDNRPAYATVLLCSKD